MSTHQVETQEQALYKAMLAFDYAQLDLILSDDVSYIHSTGVIETKSQYFAGLRQGLYEYGDITRLTGETRVFSDLALTTGLIDMLVGDQGSEKTTIRFQHVLVWRNEAGAWRLLYRQSTRVPR